MNRQLLSRGHFELYRLIHEWIDKRFHSSYINTYRGAESTLPAIGKGFFSLKKEDVESLQAEYQDVASETAYLLRDIVGYSSPYPLNYGVSAVQMEALFVVTRMLRPDVVVETGVANGLSSVAILSALNRNGRGTLFSIDPGQNLGCLIAEELKDRWVLINERSPDALLHWPNDRKVDLFHHDSLHVYRQMYSEYSAATSLGSDRFVLMSDDIAANDAFHDYCQSVGRGYCALGRYPKMEGLCAIGKAYNRSTVPGR